MASAVATLRGWRARLASHLASGQVSRVIYGAIIGLALVVALEAHPPTAIVVAVTLVGTAVAVALAELYADLIGARTRMGASVEEHGTRMIVEDAAATALGVTFPAVFFVLAALNAFTVDTAFEIAKWSGLGLIAAYGYIGGRLSGAGTGRALLQALAVGLIAAGLIALKALVH